ncbi:RNA-binding protein with serine-rich domain 1 [Aspergillus ibericus CBS 121593]|uniref:RNA-binding domain-containing protein n=1 Tax=Aspergillus ibericus CBS 121593 TaxID=1448316 RepID=A0A395GR68_9EURO|nr:RNA-binding domain-containing protein [Aspergillus ibericus CBS 121593]RAK98041.1 RNA-binding domain-containing protein [Aspergillus ibericus CBS 121593]
MSESYSRGRSRARLLPFDRTTPLQRSVSPRSESRCTSRSHSVERGAVRRNGHPSRSWSRSPSQHRVLSRSGSRSETSRRHKKREYSRTPSPSANTSRSSKIVVEKLTKNVTESHLREIFGGFGDIQSLDLPMNKAFMMNRGTAYIHYHDPADAEAAIAHMHEAQLDGAVLNVSIVLPRRAFSRSPPPVQNSRGSLSRQGHGRGPPLESRASHASPYMHRSTPPRRYRRPRHMEGHDIYRPRSLSRSRSPRRSRSTSSKSLSASPPRRRGYDARRRRRRSPSYSSYGYSSRSDRDRSLSPSRDHH